MCSTFGQGYAAGGLKPPTHFKGHYTGPFFIIIGCLRGKQPKRFFEKKTPVVSYIFVESGTYVSGFHTSNKPLHIMIECIKVEVG